MMCLSLHGTHYVDTLSGYMPYFTLGTSTHSSWQTTSRELPSPLWKWVEECVVLQMCSGLPSATLSAVTPSHHRGENEQSPFPGSVSHGYH